MLESADVAVNTDNVSAHANIRLAALPPSMPGQSGIMRDAPVERADLPPLPDDGAARGGQTIAPKGEVTGTLGVQVGPRGTVVAQGNIAVTGDIRNPVLR